jgi:hypothetical protein
MNGSSEERGELSRRRFLGITAGIPILTGARSSTRAAEVAGEVPYRTLGRTGERVSAIGVGGFHIGKPELTEPESTRIIRTAIDSGINFLDNCWDYNGGQSEVAWARHSATAIASGHF